MRIEDQRRLDDIRSAVAHLVGEALERMVVTPAFADKEHAARVAMEMTPCQGRHDTTGAMASYIFHSSAAATALEYLSFAAMGDIAVEELNTTALDAGEKFVREMREFVQSLKPRG